MAGGSASQLRFQAMDHTPATSTTCVEGMPSESCAPNRGGPWGSFGPTCMCHALAACADIGSGGEYTPALEGSDVEVGQCALQLRLHGDDGGGRSGAKLCLDLARRHATKLGGV